MTTEEMILSIGPKLRKVRESMNLTREVFCTEIHENPDYWGNIERGEQAISLPKLLQVCEKYSIDLCDVIQIKNNDGDSGLSEKVEFIKTKLLSCNAKQLKIVSSFIDHIVHMI